MIVTQTPLRISLLGGNTDFPKYFKKYGGAVLTTTIDKYVYVIVKERFDDMIYINYSVKEKVNKVDDIKHDLVREAMKLVGVDKGIEITFLSDIPSEGSGLGSSSAVTVGVLNALHNYKGGSVAARQLVEEACQIEIDILKKPIGYQDQYAIGFGGLNFFEFGKNVLRFSLSTETNNYFMLFYTGITRKSEKILKNTQFKKKILDLNKELAYKGVDALNNPLHFGSLLDEYWQLKKQLNKSVTNDFIERTYYKALLAGALGGKIVGAGGGGFLLLVVPPEKKEAVRKALGLRELPFNLSKDGSKVIFNIQK
ncbi:MAG: GHMP kinase [Candidatus Curtissbacteria bacterium]|nr:GHMP kinase [Candidatus Curtissbacteria bacterium]